MNQKSIVILFSDPNFLALNILQELINNNFLVYVVSTKKKLWVKKASSIQGSSNYQICDYKNYSQISGFSYSIFCGGFIESMSAFSDFKKYYTGQNLRSVKTVNIFPWELVNKVDQNQVVIAKNSSMVCLGDLMGQGLDLNSDLFVPRLLKEMIKKRTLTMGIGELFFPLLVSDVANFIVKNLTKSEVYGKQIVLMGNRVTSTHFWKYNTKYFRDLKVIYDTKVKVRTFPSEKEIKNLGSSISAMLDITYKWILKNNIQTTVSDDQIKKDTTNRHLNKFFSKFQNLSKNINFFTKTNIKWRVKFLRPLTLTFVAVFIFPLLVNLVGLGILFLSYKSFQDNNIAASQKTSLMAKAFFIVAKKGSAALSYIPLIGSLYKEISYASYLGENVSDTFGYISPMLNTGKMLLTNVLGTEIYDVSESAKSIESGLNYVLSKVVIVRETTIYKSDNGVKIAKQLLNILDFDRLESLVRNGLVVSKKLPILLGADTNKKYLLLFQNNMELRPTGGFIGSYGMADFSGGKLNALTVNDIYSADGQLKGHVEPPIPIKKYLGEANWWFRDSNWNPDFPTSAERAEWFLNKEMGQEVDGTLAMDLYPVKSILKYTGPVFLSDYNLTISADNLYEKTQEESHANFFPGSRKKASFLTALSRVLIDEVSKMESKQKIHVFKALYEGLESRNIQIYLHDKSLQDSIEKLSWSGSVPSYVCGSGCYSDFVANVEANLGVNKANYFISRNISFEVEINRNQVVRNMNIDISNSANPSLGLSGQYKVYLRTLIPSNAEFLEANLINGESKTMLDHDVSQSTNNKEVGVYVEILPGQTKTISFKWLNDLPENAPISSYGLYVRKQAGTGSDPFTVKFKSPSADIVSRPLFSLTDPGIYTYNTDLSKDFFARVSLEYQ